MRALRREHFERWMAEYGRASVENDSRASAELFAPDAHCFESPFDEPIVGRAAIGAYWARGAASLRDKAASYEILALNANVGIARWHGEFTIIASSKRMALDCLFVVEFNDERLCENFREWWHIQEVLPHTESEGHADPTF